MDSAAIKYSSHCVPRVEDDPSVLLGRGAGCTQCITHTARPMGQSCRCVLSALCTALLSKQCSNMTDLPQQVRATLCRTHSDSEQSPVLQSRQSMPGSSPICECWRCYSAKVQRLRGASPASLLGTPPDLSTFPSYSAHFSTRC